MLHTVKPTSVSQCLHLSQVCVWALYDMTNIAMNVFLKNIIQKTLKIYPFLIYSDYFEVCMCQTMCVHFKSYRESDYWFLSLLPESALHVPRGGHLYLKLDIILIKNSRN